jgi:tetratricopeptide (TPR) repeat protein
MRKIIFFLVLFILSPKLQAQSNLTDSLMRMGKQLSDSGHYQEAADQFKAILAKNPREYSATYELAENYFLLKDYKNAMNYSKALLKTDSEYQLPSMILYGTILDLEGEISKSISFYKKMKAKGYSNYLLDYNLAISYYHNHDINNAENELMQSIELTPGYADSHLMLAQLANETGEYVKATLALYFFLMVEPKSYRSNEALNLLHGLLRKQNVRNSDTVAIPEVVDDNLGQVSFLIKMAITNEENEGTGKAGIEKFSGLTQFVFNGLIHTKDLYKGFWWKSYLRLYSDMASDGQVETFTYYISQSSPDKDVMKWIKSNSKKLEIFAKWIDNYNN